MLNNNSKYRERQIAYISFELEQGIVRMRVAFVPRSTEIPPTFCRFVPNFF
jgi:hypothetical protein